MHPAVHEGSDKGYDAEGEYEQREDEPGGAAAGLVGGLGDAERVDKQRGQGFEQAHRSIVCLFWGEAKR